MFLLYQIPCKGKYDMVRSNEHGNKTTTVHSFTLQQCVFRNASMDGIREQVAFRCTSAFKPFVDAQGLPKMLLAGLQRHQVKPLTSSL